jgi:hypothetical protein
MKTSGPMILAALLAATVTAASYGGISGGGSGLNGISGGGAQLLLVGPVEAINASNRTAIVLGQTIHAASLERLAVGNTVAVYGTTRADGSIAASAIQSRGIYVPGATSVLISGSVQRAEPSVGRVVVSGVTVDLTSVMSHGMFSPTVGTKLQLTGVQPVSGGLVVVNGISGGGAEALGISGGGAPMGISGGGAPMGISGGGAPMGISGGGAPMGISGGGAPMGISGGGAPMGISGGGAPMGISGGGAPMGISGGGAPMGISGGGAPMGISGGGAPMGISGGGAPMGISGGGVPK